MTAALVLVACGEPTSSPPRPVGASSNGIEASPAWTSSTGSDALAPLPASAPGLDPRRVALGRTLFHDKRLSGDGRVACYDCHQQVYGGGNGQPRSVLPNRPSVPVNVPTVFNVAFDFRYAWNGRFETIEEQIDFALNAKTAMSTTWAAAIATLSRDRKLVAAFWTAYPGGLAEASVRDSLVQYTRSLVTPNARFDRYLRGEIELAADELRGYEHFRDYGCISCHQGVNVGGNMFQKFGVMLDYFKDRGGLEPADMGRYAATKLEGDRHVFRVPSLRNVARTAPYFHDGSADTLAEAITIMGRYQLGRELNRADVGDIAAFLRTLTGELDGRPL